MYFIEEFVHFVCDSDFHDHDDENKLVEEVVCMQTCRQSVGVHRYVKYIILIKKSHFNGCYNQTKGHI